MKNTGYSPEKRDAVSQEEEQQEVAPESNQPTGEGSEQNAASAPPAAQSVTSASEKKRKKKGKMVSEQELMPRPSIWPLALAIALAVVLLGAVSHPIVLAIGVLLFITAIIGTLLERR